MKSNIYVHPCGIKDSDKYPGFLPVLTKCKKKVVLIHEDDLREFVSKYSKQAERADNL